MNELEKAEAGIEKLLKLINERKAFDNPGALSGIMTRLAYYNHTVGRHLAGLQGAYRSKRAEVYNEVMQDKQAKVTHAKQKAEEGAQALESMYDHYSNIHNDTDKFITVCQSHLRILGMEARNSM